LDTRLKRRYPNIAEAAVKNTKSEHYINELTQTLAKIAVEAALHKTELDKSLTQNMTKPLSIKALMVFK